MGRIERIDITDFQTRLKSLADDLESGLVDAVIVTRDDREIMRVSHPPAETAQESADEPEWLAEERRLYPNLARFRDAMRGTVHIPPDVDLTEPLFSAAEAEEQIDCYKGILYNE